MFQHKPFCFVLLNDINNNDIILNNRHILGRHGSSKQTKECIRNRNYHNKHFKDKDIIKQFVSSRKEIMINC